MALIMVVTSAGLGQERLGVPPHDPWSCPPSHPIKGYTSTSGDRLYYVPDSRFYEEASPERCYASEDEARRDGSRPAGDDSRRRAPVLSAREPRGA